MISMKKYILITTAIVLAIVVGLIITARISEDTWLCQNGQWVKHGNPDTAMPTEPCGEEAPRQGNGNNLYPNGNIETMTVKIFFGNSNLDPEASCNKVFGVERTIPKTQAVARAALEELFKGPSDEEKNQGYFTSINPGVQINQLVIKDRVAEADFDETLEFQVGGSCRVAAIAAQIRETLLQFPTVDKVIISIDGRTEDILQP